MAEFRTNIKNLPTNRTYFTECGYSQKYPWMLVKRTAKTATLVKVNVKRDPDWKPEMSAGGFAGHCHNQSEQTWLFDGIEAGHTITVRLVKCPYHGADFMWARKGVRFLENVAEEFYDYNF